MRLFIAASLAPEHLDVLQRAQNILAANSSGLPLTKPENLHLTLHFIGEVTKEEVLLLQEVMMRARFPVWDKLTASITGYGTLRRDDGDLIYAKLDASEAWLTVLERINDGLKKNNFPVAKRNWKPHVTLARRAQLDVPLNDLVSKLPLSVEQIKLPSVNLFKSEFTPQGMLYTSILRRS